MERQTNRHEIKYTVSAYETQLLKYRLPALLRRDKHAGAKGSYLIRSVYFDDGDFTAYHEKIAGVKERTKYRLRYYDLDDRVIFFECKSKNGDMTGKNSVRVTRTQAQALLDGSFTAGDSDAPLLREFSRLRRTGFRPVVIVDYDRYAFTYPLENVRVTLDTAVRTCPYQTDFFDKRLVTVPVMDNGETVLEVKYDKFLPAPVSAVLEGIPKRREAVSKYVKCLSILE